MKPIEKAQELVESFEKFAYSYEEGLHYDQDNDLEWNAKQCALICVDEILLSIQDLVCEDVKWDYWNGVKQEIEKL